MPDLRRNVAEPAETRGTAWTCAAARSLGAAIARTGSAMSIGLEPCAAYLPAGFEDTIAGHERFLRTIIDATAGIAAAYKFNLAFFEALGTPGWDLMYRVRERLPDDVLVIADAKRGDIGTTAEHYAKALYGTLGANAATVNPLMGRDACEPFLAYEDALTFVLVLTSNPGASDFLLADSMYRRIARKVVDWNTRGNAGMVVGATRAEQVAEVRAIAGDVPFLIPGVGAQGGDLEAVARNGQWNVERAHEKNRQAGLLFHVTRGVLPGKEEAGDAERVIRRKSEEWHRRIAAALAAREVAP